MPVVGVGLSRSFISIILVDSHIFPKLVKSDNLLRATAVIVWERRMDLFVGCLQSRVPCKIYVGFVASSLILSIYSVLRC
jgi:hypothetical protein